METIYDWLLHNTENAGNYYTILNTQRSESGSLEVMARSSDFKVFNLFIRDTQGADSAENKLDTFPGESVKDTYVFGSEQQVIAYLAEGKIPESGQNEGAAGLQVLVAEPTSEAGSITFPPAQK